MSSSGEKDGIVIGQIALQDVQALFTYYEKRTVHKNMIYLKSYTLVDILQHLSKLQLVSLLSSRRRL